MTTSPRDAKPPVPEAWLLYTAEAAELDAIFSDLWGLIPGNRATLKSFRQRIEALVLSARKEALAAQLAELAQGAVLLSERQIEEVIKAHAPTFLDVTMTQSDRWIADAAARHATAAMAARVRVLETTLNISLAGGGDATPKPTVPLHGEPPAPARPASHTEEAAP